MSANPNDSTLGTAEVIVIEHPPGFTIGCKLCRKIISQGNFAIGLIVQDKGREYKYFIGHDPKLVCCGEEKTIIRVFATAEEAKPVCSEILAHLAQTNSTQGLPLLDWTIPGNN